MHIIEVSNLYKIFGAHKDDAFNLLEQGATKEEILEKTGCTVAIDNASFQVEQGETFVIMGLSGSGKSTIIRCLNRLIEPTKGTITIDGEEILHMSKEKLREVRRNKMSMVFQNFGLLPHRTVLGNVEFGLEIIGVDLQQRREKAQKAIEKVGLKGYEQSMPGELSGGMQQRVGLARAIANDPEILLMDEAFSALDPLIRTQMQDELLDLQAELHKTIVFITHDLDEALKIGDRIVILGQGGKVVQIGTAEEILSEPADEYVRSFVQNVDRSKVITAGSIMRKANTLTIPKDGPGVAARRMDQLGISTMMVVDHDRVLKGIVHIDDVVKLVNRKEKDLAPIIKQDLFITKPHVAIGDLLTSALKAKYPIAVLDTDWVLHGAIDRASIIAEVGTDQSPSIRLRETLGDVDPSVWKEV